MKAILTGVDPLIVCDECAQAIFRQGTPMEDIATEWPCDLCWRNKTEATCVRCKTKTLFYGSFPVPRFEGMLGGGREHERWDKFLGLITLALCQSCFEQKWTLLHSYVVGNQVIVFRNTTEWHYPAFEETEIIKK